MKKSDQKKYAHLPAIEGGIVTSVRKDETGQIVYTYDVPDVVWAKQKADGMKLNAKADADDIGQGEGCEGGKCSIPVKQANCPECGTAKTCRACKAGTKL